MKQHWTILQWSFQGPHKQKACGPASLWILANDGKWMVVCRIIPVKTVSFILCNSFPTKSYGKFCVLYQPFKLSGTLSVEIQWTSEKLEVFRQSASEILKFFSCFSRGPVCGYPLFENNSLFKQVFQHALEIRYAHGIYCIHQKTTCKSLEPARIPKWQSDSKIEWSVKSPDCCAASASILMNCA